MQKTKFERIHVRLKSSATTAVSVDGKFLYPNGEGMFEQPWTVVSLNPKAVREMNRHKKLLDVLDGDSESAPSKKEVGKKKRV
jgi:hypothetical protein